MLNREDLKAISNLLHCAAGKWQEEGWEGWRSYKEFAKVIDNEINDLDTKKLK
jgi:hypothetical protein